MIPSQRNIGRIEYGCCVQCRRDVPLTTAIAVEVTKGGEIAGYLHRFHCQGEWQAAIQQSTGMGCRDGSLDERLDDVTTMRLVVPSPQ